MPLKEETKKLYILERDGGGGGLSLFQATGHRSKINAAVPGKKNLPEELKRQLLQLPAAQAPSSRYITKPWPQ